MLEQNMSGTNLSTYPIHLGLGARASIEPVFTGNSEWYEAYGGRHAADGAEARLVSQFTFTEPWSSWEMHPNGHEVVLCISGTMVLHQEHPDGTRSQVTLEPGQYAINAPGVWHTADISGSATGVFITAGLGTQIRPR
jgi:mannose-6-phosphate isomerase-like protein (cupin superfamily)